MCEAASSSQRVMHVASCQSPSSLPVADGSPPGGCTGRAGRREGMKHLMHVLPVRRYTVKYTI